MASRAQNLAQTSKVFRRNREVRDDKKAPTRQAHEGFLPLLQGSAPLGTLDRMILPGFGENELSDATRDEKRSDGDRGRDWAYDSHQHRKEHEPGDERGTTPQEATRLVRRLRWRRPLRQRALARVGGRPEPDTDAAMKTEADANPDPRSVLDAFGVDDGETLDVGALALVAVDALEGSWSRSRRLLSN
jgi:hypothetical protein